MAQETLGITGMDCAECALTLERGVAAMPGVRDAQVNFTLARMTLDYDPQQVDRAAIVGRVRKLGYDVDEGTRERGGAEQRSLQAWVRDHRQETLVAAGGVLTALAFALRLLGMPALASHALYTIATAFAGYTSARAAWAALRTVRSLDMNVLMTLAAIGALAIGEFEEGAVVTLLFALGNLLESLTLDRARNAIRALMDLSPPQATRLSARGEEVVPVERLVVGDRILVRPGERIAMDGSVLEGHSAINQAPITGESMPVEKAPGEKVFAGTVNGSSVLTVEVTRLAVDNTLSRVIQMVEEAQAQRAPSQRFVDRFARVYTPIVVVGALLFAAVPPLVGLGPFTDWLYRGLVLLVIACPCALVISTPVTIVSGVARAARAGVLIKGGAYLEQAGALQVVAFDKTGTLTQGAPRVVDCGCDRYDADARPQRCTQCLSLLSKAAAVERRSEHPLARAIIQRAQALGIDRAYAPAGGVEAAVGQGVRGRVDGHSVAIGSHAYVHGDHHGGPLCDEMERAAADGQTIVVIEDECCNQTGYVVVADRLRESVPVVVADLRRAGIQRTVMLTGDNEETARTISASAGVDEFRANLLPGQKVEAMEQLLAQYGKVAMVGDGINDAPALARATVGIVMGAAGSDAALETADIALMADDLTKLPFTIQLSRRVVSIIRQNVALSLLIKAIFLALAVAGRATLWMAVFADMGASLIVTLNGMRVLGYRDLR